MAPKASTSIGGNRAQKRSVSDQPDIRLLLTCADLLTGAEQLAHRTKHGLPDILKTVCEPPDVVLRRLLTTIRHIDLPGGFGPLWGACAALWKKGKAATLEQGALQVENVHGESAASALRFCRARGMGVGYQAPAAAERLVRFRENQRTQREAMQIAAKAAGETERVFDGVV